MQSLVDLCALVLRKYPKFLLISKLPIDLVDPVIKKMTRPKFFTIKEIDEVREAKEYFTSEKYFDHTYFQKAVLIHNTLMPARLMVKGLEISANDRNIEHMRLIVKYMIRYLVLEKDWFRFLEIILQNEIYDFIYSRAMLFNLLDEIDKDNFKIVFGCDYV